MSQTQRATVTGVDYSQGNFNTGIVVIVGHGVKPSPQLIERANGIGHQLIEYWSTVTGHRAVMNMNPR